MTHTPTVLLIGHLPKKAVVQFEHRLEKALHQDVLVARSIAALPADHFDWTGQGWKPMPHVDLVLTVRGEFDLPGTLAQLHTIDFLHMSAVPVIDGTVPHSLHDFLDVLA